jgi:nucleoside triphosphate diphosphatase
VSELADALGRLDEITRRLRRDCPWDREQDARSIVPHTVEEAYEVAEAAHSDDPAKLLDELGDLLFQVYFLALLLEERGEGDLAQIADHCREKLIRRHPHVFGETRAETAGEVLRNWGEIKRVQERGGEVFSGIAETLPGPLYARKAQRRATSSGRVPAPEPPDAAERVREAAARLAEAAGRAKAGPGEPDDDRRATLAAAGDLLFAAVQAAGAAGADPELALRQATERFMKEND